MIVDARRAVSGFRLREGNENSRFGEQVNDYADLYTSRVSNFGPYSPLRYFRGRCDRYSSTAVRRSDDCETPSAWAFALNAEAKSSVIHT